MEELIHRIRNAKTSEQANRLLSLFFNTYTDWCIINWKEWKELEDKLWKEACMK